MDNRRGWAKAKATKGWGALLLNPKIKRDGGRPKENPLRLRIPSYLTGESESVSEEEAFMTKQLEVEGKQEKNMGVEMYDALREECARGFGDDLSSSAFAETSNFALGAGALTGDEVATDRHASSIMAGALTGGKDSCLEEGASVKFVGFGVAPAVAASSACAPASSPAKGKPSHVDQHDISLVRNRAHDTQTKAPEANIKDVENIVAESRGTLAEVIEVGGEGWHNDREPLTARIETCELFLGKHCKLAEDSTISWADHADLKPPANKKNKDCKKHDKKGGEDEAKKGAAKDKQD